MTNTHQTNTAPIRIADSSFLVKGDLLVKVASDGIVTPYINVLNTKSQERAQGRVTTLVWANQSAIHESIDRQDLPFVLMSETRELKLNSVGRIAHWESRTSPPFNASLEQQLTAQGFRSLGESGGIRYFIVEYAARTGSSVCEAICAVRGGALIGFWFKKNQNEIGDREIILNDKTRLAVPSSGGQHQLGITAGPFKAIIEQGDYGLELKKVSWDKPPSSEDLKLALPKPFRDTESSLMIRGQNTPQQLQDKENKSFGKCNLEESTRIALWRYALELQQLQSHGVNVSHQALGDMLAYAIALGNLSSPASVIMNGTYYTITAGGPYLSTTSNPYDDFRTTRRYYFLRKETTGEEISFTDQDARCIAWYGDYRKMGGSRTEREEHSPRMLASFLGFTGQSLHELQIP